MRKTISDGGLIGLTVFLWIVYLWLNQVKLVTEVWPGELRVRLRGLGRRRRVPLAEITSVKIVTFDPIRDFGGYGVRAGRKSTAYIAGGRQGVRLDLKSGRSLVIGSGRPKELAGTLKRLQSADERS